MEESKRPFISLFAGVTGGVVACIICAPLDVVKVRMQVQGSVKNAKYTGAYSIIKNMIFEEGIRGCFKGLGPALLTTPVFWGIYWCSYNMMMDSLPTQYPSVPIPVWHISSAVIAGCAGDVFTNPFWVVRTRIQTLIMHSSDIPLNIIPKQEILSNNISAYQMFKVIFKEEGFVGFYKGLGASLLGLSHVALQFPLYEYLKMKCREYRQGQEHVQDILAASVISKLTASVFTYPHEMLRSRLQDARNIRGKGLIHLTKEIIRKEGLLALWTGFPLNVVRVIPATGSTFLTYEYIMRYYFNDCSATGDRNHSCHDTHKHQHHHHSSSQNHLPTTTVPPKFN